MFDSLRTTLSALLIVAVMLVVTLRFFFGPDGYHEAIVWSMVHVSGDRQSGDAHLLEFPDGHRVLIDTGFDRYARSNLIPYLDARGVKRIDQLVITHGHRNHYGGAVSLLRHLDALDQVYFNKLERRVCESETWPSGCDYMHILGTRGLLEAAGASISELARGDVVYADEDRGIELSVVYVHDGVSPPVGFTRVNDTSLVLRLEFGSTSVLFSGDLNQKVGRHLTKGEFELTADILTAPHHGVESAADNKFLRRVDPQVMMVSVSAPVWLGERGERMRTFAAKRGMPAYVTGLHGNVKVIMTHDDYRIETQFDFQPE